MSAKPTSEARADTTCRHGWRGTVPENGERIVTPCPSCGRRTLFIGTGGHLTCGNLGPDCKEPGVERQIELMKSQLAAQPHPAAPADAGDAMRVAQIIEDVIEGRFPGTPINKGSSAIMMLEEALAAARRLLDAPPGVGETLTNIRTAASLALSFGRQATPQTPEKMIERRDERLRQIIEFCDRAGVSASILRDAAPAPAEAGSVATGEGGE